MNRLALTALAVGLLVGASASYLIVSSAQPRAATTTSAASTAGPGSQASRVVADLLLNAPFEGPTLSITANSTVGSGDRSAPFTEVLFAQYTPEANASAAAYSGHYFGSFTVATFTPSNQSQATAGEDVALTVSYAGRSVTGAVEAPISGGETTVIPIAMGALLQAGQPIELSVSDGAAACPALGGSWREDASTCYLYSLPTQGTLTIDPGVSVTIVREVVAYGTVVNRGTIHNDGGIINAGTVENYGTISGGALYNNDVIDNSGVVEVSLIHNYAAARQGTINNDDGGTIRYGGIMNFGTVNNNGTITGDYSGFINKGTVNNGGVINNNGSAGYIANYGTIVNRGTINNQGVLCALPGSRYDGNRPTNRPIRSC